MEIASDGTSDGISCNAFFSTGFIHFSSLPLSGWTKAMSCRCAVCSPHPIPATSDSIFPLLSALRSSASQLHRISTPLDWLLCGQGRGFRNAASPRIHRQSTRYPLRSRTTSPREEAQADDNICSWNFKKVVDLRGDVYFVPRHVIARLQCTSRGDGRAAEIADLQHARVCIHQQVLGFDVSMRDAYLQIIRLIFNQWPLFLSLPSADDIALEITARWTFWFRLEAAC